METFTSRVFEDADRIRRELEALADPAYRDFQARRCATTHEDSQASGPKRRARSSRRSRTGPTTRTTCTASSSAGWQRRPRRRSSCSTPSFRTSTTGRPATSSASPPSGATFRRCSGASAAGSPRLGRIRGWVAADPEYTVRFGVVQLMTLFLGDTFEPEHLALVAGIDRPEYYVNMARAWYFSFALIKQPAATLPLFERRPIALDPWTHNKALQKARESRRVAPEQKAYLQSLKV